MSNENQLEVQTLTEDEAYMLLDEWQSVSDLKKEYTAREEEMRRQLFEFFFPRPSEGSNTVTLDDGRRLVAQHRLNRSIDEPSLQANKPELERLGIPVDALVRYKPELQMKEYRKLTGDLWVAFEQCLTTKPGMPALEIKLPARARKGRSDSDE